MICFLTSSAYDEYENLQTKNNFLENLRSFWSCDCNVLYIASFPDSFEITDEYFAKHKNAFKLANLTFKNFDLIDHRNSDKFDYYVSRADVIILCGGHCPTEMKFFEELKLREKLTNFKGIIISTSAGSMNSANIVYAQPELEGETSKDYQKYFRGLGLTNINILPHYHEYKNFFLDGLRVYEDITYPDSKDKTFYCFPDGTYLFQGEDKEETIYGEFYTISDGVLSKIQDDNQKFNVINQNR